VEIVLQVHNEEHVLAASVARLLAHMRSRFEFPFTITIADNASADGTLALARELARRQPEVQVLHLDEKGGGRALRAAWGASRAQVLAYMDIDLSTGLDALGELLVPLLEGRGDIAIGSRLIPEAQVQRGLRRELVSRSYNALLRLALHAGFADAQCGFKAGRREVLQALLPRVRDEAWFFDTELLHLAQRERFAIREIPVHWIEDRDWRVAVAATALEDLRGILRLRREERAGRAQAPAAGSMPAAPAAAS
jgi:glycosyltransferase involved in cell wall biosynthesis